MLPRPDPVHVLAQRHAHVPASGTTATAWIDTEDLRSLLCLDAPALLPAAWRAQAQAAQRVRVVLSEAGLREVGEPDLQRVMHSLHRAVEAALGRALPIQLLVLGQACVDDTATPNAFDALVAAVSDRLLEARRRSPQHFERAPLGLPRSTQAPLHALDTDAVAAFIASRADALDDGVHWLQGGPVCSPRELVQAVADALGVACRGDAATPADPGDAVGRLVDLELAHARAVAAELFDTAPRASAPGMRRHLFASTFDWRARAAAEAGRRRDADGAGTAPRFDTLAGLARRSTHDGHAYLCVGHGPRALVLLNAFGMSLDVWSRLVDRLRDDCTVLVIDADGHQPASGLPRAYYDSPDGVDRFAAALHAVLRAEGLPACHLVGWCAGAKYAVELARRMPQAVASLSLLAPSFAGEPSVEGGDSPFENSLNTLCKLVDRMPQSAENMARSMLAMLSKESAPADPSATDGSASFALADQATLPWLHAPFVSADHMLTYSRQLVNFRAHAVAREARLHAPVLLVTGERDASTCSLRARSVCAALCEPCHFELQEGGHYFIHQNAELTATLLARFLRDGQAPTAPHPRLRAVHTPAPDRHEDDALVSGEL